MRAVRPDGTSAAKGEDEQWLVIRMHKLICSAVLACMALVPVAKAADHPATLFDMAYLRKLAIKPSATDPTVTQWDTPSRVYYDRRVEGNELLLFLTGTSGTPDEQPGAFFHTANVQGYRIISLSFISEPAVGQVCVGRELTRDRNCALQFRNRRLFGEGTFAAIPDKPQDAIVNRFTKLLQYLVSHDPDGQWQHYLKGDQPDWSQVAVAGQSQGGGMAELLAQKVEVARVISFSGGWDFSSQSPKVRIARWYGDPAVTPADRWYGTYHVKEPGAKVLKQTYEALKIPAAHIYALKQEPDFAHWRNPKHLPKWVPYHTEGVNDKFYEPMWKVMLGDGEAGAPTG